MFELLSRKVGGRAPQELTSSALECTSRGFSTSTIMLTGSAELNGPWRDYAYLVGYALYRRPLAIAHCCKTIFLKASEREICLTMSNALAQGILLRF